MQTYTAKDVSYINENVGYTLTATYLSEKILTEYRINSQHIVLWQTLLNKSRFSDDFVEHAQSEESNFREHLDPSGNWCGHDPANPRYYDSPSVHKLRPDIIQFAIKSLQKFYMKPQEWLRSLFASRESNRQERTEARERDAAVLGVLLHYADLATLRVGVPLENGEFFSLDMKFIAKQLGWRTEVDDKEDAERKEAGKEPRNKGVKRVWRSINNLKKAGYLDVHKRCERREGAIEGEQEYSGLPAVRQLKVKLFFELGIKPERLEHRRKQAAKRLKKKYRGYLNKIEEELKKGVTGAVEKLREFVNPKRSNKRAFNDRYQLEKEKRRQAQAIELIQLPENRDLSADEFYTKFSHLKPSNWPSRE